MIFRDLQKNKFYSFVKIGGFAISISACILIFVYIRFETSYDKYYPKAENIYRLVAGYDFQGESVKGVHFPAPMYKALKEEFPEIEKSGRILNVELFGAGEREVRTTHSKQSFHETSIMYADQAVLDIFNIPIVSGDKNLTLDEPNSVVITKSLAQKYFNDMDPLGEFLILDNNTDNPLKVNGIIEDLPQNSHIRYNMLISLKNINFYNGEQDNWGSSNYYTYMLLKPEADIKKLEKKITKVILDKYWGPVLSEYAGEEFVKSIFFEVAPVEDIHLKSTDIDDLMVHGDMRYIWMFGSIALFILLIACINFINLSTAKSANKAKEVGLRKTVGSKRSQLINQFLTESFIYSFVSFLLGAFLAQVLLTPFNAISGKALSLPWTTMWFIPSLIVMTIITGILSGIYPSFYLSKFKPVGILKGNLSLGSKSSTLRSSLVVFQFTTSIILIIGSLIIQNQMDYILKKNLGYEKEQVVMIRGTNTIGNKVLEFKEELKNLNEIENATISDYLPITGTLRNTNTFYVAGSNQLENQTGAQKWNVDADYIKTLGLKIIEGRDFNTDIRSDENSIIITKKFAEDLLLDEPVGTMITDGGNTWEVIGVIENVFSESLKQEVVGIGLTLNLSTSIVSVKVKPNDIEKALSNIQIIWNNFYPDQSFRYTFLDDQYTLMYRDVQRIGKIFMAFTILAIMIASLGLFSLSAFMSEQRGKEISIRQVVGASFNDIFSLLSMEFIRLIIISLVIAAPIAWIIMQNWLDSFAYHINFGWRTFLISGIASVSIAFLTISYHTILALLRNPASTLRTE